MESTRRSLMQALGQSKLPFGQEKFQRPWTRCSSGEPPEATTVEELVALIASSQTTWFAATQRGLHSLDSSACAALFKELCRKGHSSEAFRIFDWLRGLDAEHELTRLLDVYTYTTMIAQCGTNDRIARVEELIREMRQKGVQCNVHTYTALMHVYAKTDQTDLALGIPEAMKKDGCTPNLVTFNTLINLFRKMGEWKRAVDVIDLIDNLNIPAEAKTYNAVIGACSSSGQPDKALYVYQRMLARNVQPSATTYTALISAHGKKGLIQEALAIFSDMVQRGCERNVITYSSLIGACEKTGQWEMAFQLFRQMKSEGIQPNIITFNSMMTACATSAKWAQACEVYRYMTQAGCRPDPTTYLTLFGALIKGNGEWLTALSIAEDMLCQGYSRPDHTLYQALMEILWMSGNSNAQAKALQLWRNAHEDGTIRFAVHAQGREFSADVFTCSAAVITVLMWIHKIKTYRMDAADLCLYLKCGRRSVIDQSVLEIRDAIVGALDGIGAPFQAWLSDQTICIEGTCERKKREEWFSGVDCSRLIGTIDQVATLPSLTSAMLSELTFKRWQQCSAAFRSVLDFEAVHGLCFVDLELLPERSSIVQKAVSYAAGFGFRLETGLDAVWLLDRLVASRNLPGQFFKEKLPLLICVCVLSIGTSIERNTAGFISPNCEFPLEDMADAKSEIKRALNDDLCALSPLRILNLFGEVLGSCMPLGMFCHDDFEIFRLVITHLAQHPISLQLPSSALACCVFYEMRRLLKIYPSWPSEMLRLTGFSVEGLLSLIQTNSVITEALTKHLAATSHAF